MTSRRGRKARCDLMGVEPYSEADGMLVRRFLTTAHDEALKTLAFWMEQAGMTRPPRPCRQPGRPLRGRDARRARPADRLAHRQRPQRRPL